MTSGSSNGATEGVSIGLDTYKLNQYLAIPSQQLHYNYIVYSFNILTSIGLVHRIQCTRNIGALYPVYQQ